MVNIELKDTSELMSSEDYKVRFIAEYWQAKIRYNKLNTFCNRIEAAQMIFDEEPVHSCPLELLKSQLESMSQYLHKLEIRAIIENVDISEKSVFNLLHPPCFANPRKKTDKEN